MHKPLPTQPWARLGFLRSGSVMSRVLPFPEFREKASLAELWLSSNTQVMIPEGGRKYKQILNG